MTTPVRTFVTIIIFFLAGPFQVGYHAAVFNQPQAVMETFVSRSFRNQFEKPPTSDQVTRLWSLNISMFGVGALVVQLFFGQQILDHFGRKCSLYLAAVFNLGGTFSQILAYKLNLYQLLILGRVGSGIGSCCGFYTCLVFASEIAPTAVRGSAGVMAHAGCILGSILANILGLPAIFGTETLWPHLLTIDLLILAPFLVSAWKFPESPKHLLTNRNQPNLALESLAFYNSPESDMEKLLGTLRSESVENNDLTTSKWRMVNLIHFLKSNNNYLRPTVAVICLGLCGPFSGHTTVLGFAVYIFSKAGLGPAVARFAAVFYWFIDLSCATLGLWLIESQGRRLMVMVGAWGSSLALSVLFVCQTIEQYNLVFISQNLLAAVTIATVFFHAFSKSPLICVQNTFSGEVFPSFIRSAAVTYFHAVPDLTFATVLAFAYLPVEREIGSFALLILLVIPMFILACALSFIFPETKGQHVCDIVQKFVESEKQVSRDQ